MIPSTDPWGEHQRQADQRMLASVALGALVVGGIVVCARSPRARRLAWMGAKFALTTWLPAWGMTQVRAAWTETAPAPTVPPLAPRADADRA